MGKGMNLLRELALQFRKTSGVYEAIIAEGLGVSHHDQSGWEGGLYTPSILLYDCVISSDITHDIALFAEQAELRSKVDRPNAFREDVRNASFEFEVSAHFSKLGILGVHVNDGTFRERKTREWQGEFYICYGISLPNPKQFFSPDNESNPYASLAFSNLENSLLSGISMKEDISFRDVLKSSGRRSLGTFPPTAQDILISVDPGRKIELSVSAFYDHKNPIDLQSDKLFQYFLVETARFMFQQFYLKHSDPFYGMMHRKGILQ